MSLNNCYLTGGKQFNEGYIGMYYNHYKWHFHTNNKLKIRNYSPFIYRCTRTEKNSSINGNIQQQQLQSWRYCWVLNYARFWVLTMTIGVSSCKEEKLCSYKQKNLY